MMRYPGLLGLVVILGACSGKEEYENIVPVDWNERTIVVNDSDSLKQGSTYLSIYSQIYSTKEHRTHDLTVTVSLRNTSKTDSVFIERADYFDTHGELIRTYFDKTIYIGPMETVEIVIAKDDNSGGTGGNFVFNWMSPPETEPLFEAIMISTSGSQGLSFSTRGIRID